MNATNQDPASLTTPALWEATHKALCANAWGEARPLLDELGTRSGNRYRLASVEGYMTRPLAPSYRQLIQDRIDLVNSKTDY